LNRVLKKIKSGKESSELNAVHSVQIKLKNSLKCNQRNIQGIKFLKNRKAAFFFTAIFYFFKSIN